MSGMVAGWIVSVSLFVICGGVALLLVKVVTYLDRTTLLAEDIDVEEPPDEQGDVAPVGDLSMTPALASATESAKLNEPLVHVDAMTHVDGELDGRSSAVHARETPPDCGTGLTIPGASGRDGSPADSR